MKRNSLIILISMIVLVTVLSISAEEKKRDFSFPAKECNLYIPSNYSVGVTNNGNMTFVPSIGADMSNASVFTIVWTENPDFKIAKLREDKDTQVLRFEKINHIKKLLIQNSLGKFTILVGKTFYIQIKHINGDASQKFIESCNNTWNVNDQNFHKDDFLKHLRENFDISNEERGILVKTIEKFYN